MFVEAGGRMNLRHLQDNTSLRDKLAAEYVLGTLKGGARRRFERWMHADAGIARAVAEWQARLQPMAEFAHQVQPPQRVWSAIEITLGLGMVRSAAKQPRPVWDDWFSSVAFWRNLGLGTAALATVLVAILVLREPAVTPLPATYVATLTDDKSQPVLVVSGSPAKRELTVRIVASQHIAADKSLELWAVPKTGAPQSLGLVAASQTVTLRLPENVTPETVPLLAVSLEPKGGSPNRNAPSGPILFKGSWVRI
jgi:anti-sigma-K factor RskA